MSESFDLAILGGGSAGLTGARFAAKLGARVVLIEKHRIGGDCTWTGCVPSKALLKAARVAKEARGAPRFGVDVGEVRVDMTRVREHVASAIRTVYDRETKEELEKTGIEVLLGAAELTGPGEIRVAGREVRARHIIIATGARPRVPDVRGIRDVPYVTHEQFFDNDRLPAHLLVLGAGPIGVELGQAYRRLGAEVTMLGKTLLPRESVGARGVIERVLMREGVRVLNGTALEARRDGDAIELDTSLGTLRGDMLLVAVGRTPNVEGLGLDRLGIRHGPDGIEVDDAFRTSAPDVYAAGDVTGGPQFTHLAAWQCFRAVRNALLPGSSRGSALVVPAVTYCDPEIGRVGMSIAEARSAFGDDVRVHERNLEVCDRAVCEGEIDGFIEIVTRRDLTVVGATIVAPRAGEMIAELGLAVQNKLSLTDLAETIHAYPTFSISVQEIAADASTARFVDSTGGKITLALCRLGRPR